MEAKPAGRLQSHPGGNVETEKQKRLGNRKPALPVAGKAGLGLLQRSKNARISVSPQHFSGTAKRKENFVLTLRIEEL